MFSSAYSLPAPTTGARASQPALELFVYPAPAWQLRLAREDRDALATVLGVTIEPDWPVFPESLAQPPTECSLDWGPFFGIELSSRRLLAIGGFYAPPDELGRVEFGYAIAAAARGRRLGLAFARSLLCRAWIEPRVRMVDAHTLADDVISEEGFDNRASVAMLRRLGFACIGGDQQTLHWRLMRDDSNRA